MQTDAARVASWAVVARRVVSILIGLAGGIAFAVWWLSRPDSQKPLIFLLFILVAAVPLVSFSLPIVTLHFSNATTVRLARSDVFEALLDPVRTMRWNNQYMAFDVITPPPTKVGSTGRATLQNGRTLSVTVTELEEPTLIRERVVSPGAVHDVLMQLAESGEDTTVTCTTKVKSRFASA